jgi:branched-chain amino acid transport system permease protein
MVYGIIGLINFAHGDVLMVGALTSWTMIGWMMSASTGLPGWMILLLATLIAMVVCAVSTFRSRNWPTAACATRHGWRP